VAETSNQPEVGELARTSDRQTDRQTDRHLDW